MQFADVNTPQMMPPHRHDDVSDERRAAVVVHERHFNDKRVTTFDDLRCSRKDVDLCALDVDLDKLSGWEAVSTYDGIEACT